MTVGRNDRCPCGSGKKYKQCCLQLGATTGEHTQKGDTPCAPVLTKAKVPRAFREALEHNQAGRPEEAVTLLNEIVQVEANHGDAWYMLGALSSVRGDDEGAAECMEKARKISPNNRTYLVNLAIMLIRLERHGEAERHLRRALTKNIGDAEIVFHLGCALLGQKKGAEAEECFLRVLKRKPDHVEAQLNLAHALFAQARLNDAQRGYQAALALDPTRLAAHWGLAGILNEQGRLEEAKVHLDRFFRHQNLFVTNSKTAVRTVLLVADAGIGNVPYEFLFPKEENSIVRWMAQYAAIGQEKQLPPFDIIFNTGGNPDMPPYTPAALSYLASCGRPLLNRPERIPLTARELMPKLFGDIEGICIPAVWRIETPGDWDGVTENDLPIIVRPLGTQGGVGLTLIDTPAALAEEKSQVGKRYVSTYHDYRLADGYYRKYRIIYIDRRPYPYHLAISEKWLVHYFTANMESVPAKLEEERRFLEAPAKVLGPARMAAIEAIGQRLDLDYAGVDFSILPDGRLLLFEANATMWVHEESADGVLSFKNPYVRRISEAFNALLDQVSRSA